MKKLKGITINGEWLGDNIKINANFRAICNLAPFVIQEFAKLINLIEKLDSAVAINSFYFPDNNTVDIKFSNNSISGLANLCFHLQDGFPELINRSLTIYTDKQENIEECEIKKSEEISNKKSENKKIDIAVENIEESKKIDNIEEVEEICEIPSIDVVDDAEENLSELYDTTIAKNNTDATIEEENETTLYSQINTQDSISMMVEDLSTKAPALAPIQIQIVQAVPNPSELPETEQSTQEINSEIVEPEKSPAVENEGTALAIEEDNEDKNYEPIEANIEIDNKNTELPSSDNIECSINENNKDFSIEESKLKISNEYKINNEPENSTKDKIINDNKIFEGNENADFTFENKIKSKVEVVQDENIVENEIETQNLKISVEEEQEIQDCLSDFYESTPNPPIEKIELKDADNLAMQAMLNEMFVLRDELNKLKNEKVTYEDIFGKKEKMKNNIEDEDADFRIMGSEERINASILDEELFIDGDKLYKWADTLYLDE